MRIKATESEIQKAILEYLTLKKIWHIRLNTGAMSGSHKGKRWFVKFGKPGMADILATTWYSLEGTTIWWIEVKRPGGRQNPEQLIFQKEVENEGHRYILADNLDAVIGELKHG